MVTNGGRQRDDGAAPRWRPTIRAAAWLSAAAVLYACGSGGDASSAGRDAVVSSITERCADLGLTNAVDAALCPRMQGAGLQPRWAEVTTVCRRMALDLLDRGPEWSEVEAHCLGRSPAEMADHFLAQPAYVRAAQRRWADHFEYNDILSWHRYIRALDDLVGQLYRDELDYERFAIEALVAPGYTGRHLGEAAVARAFQVFLGRDAHGVEREDLVGLWRMWSPYQAVDPDYGFDTFRVVVVPATCAPPLDELLCHSSLYGEREVVLPLPNPADPDAPENLLHVEDLTEAQWAVLRAPGEVIAALPFFHEHAVSEALDRLVGWPASRALPEVRAALVRFFVDEAALSVRALEREIVTSALYLQTAAPLEAGAEPEPWRRTPLKQMRTEAWLDTIAGAARSSLGRCDHRYGLVRFGYDPASGRQRFIPHDYPVANPDTGEPDRTYQRVAQALGGCPDHQNAFRFTGTGVVHALVQEQVIQLMCYRPESAGLLPGDAFGSLAAVDDTPAGLEALLSHQTRALLSREPSPAEITAFVDDAAGCVDAGTCDLATLPGQTCAALLQSAAFQYY